MTRVVKGNGRSEDFDREKIMESLMKSGVSRSIASEIADKIPEKEGISTDQIRELVNYELRIRDPEAASRYRKDRYLREIASLHESDC